MVPALLLPLCPLGLPGHLCVCVCVCVCVLGDVEGKESDHRAGGGQEPALSFTSRRVDPEGSGSGALGSG